MAKKLIVIDGNSLLFRAYYATSYGDESSIMRTKEGIPTNAIFAFSNMLSKIMQKFEGGELLFIGFDADSKTFRKEEYESYKANRKPCPEELIKQFPISRELLDCLNVAHYEQQGIEADDICGTIAKKGSEEGYEVSIYTSDKDYLQLVDDNITVHLIRKGLSDVEDVTPGRMVELFGFEPMQIIDYKGLRGDSSDNLPGIPGVGEKTAVKLITEYGDFESIIQAAKDGKIKGKLAENIIANEELGRVCFHLATILTECDLPFSLEDLVYEGYDFSKIAAFCQKYELRQFLGRLPQLLKKEGMEEAMPVLEIVSSLPKINASKIGLAIDISASTYNDDELLGISIYDGKGLYYLSKKDAENDAELIRILKDPAIQKYVYDGKMAFVSLHNIGLELNGVGFDLLLCAYLLDAGVTTPEIVFSTFGADISSSEGLDLFSSSNVDQTGKMAYYALKKAPLALKRLEEEGSKKLYEEIELPLSRVLGEMEIEGFPLHEKDLMEIGQTFRQKRDELEQKIYETSGYRFNISSPKQVADVLYGKLLLAGGKVLGTSVEVLQSLHHPLADLILQYRKYSKLVGTYIDGLAPHIKKDGKIHTCFNQALTTTGRLSSSNPNLQNISSRDEESKLIRKAFYYDDQNLRIVSLDYGQIELRILAALSHCSSYIDIFATDRDVHTETARKIFMIPDGEDVPSLCRRRAKAVNFAIIYGVTPFGLADQIGGSVQEAMSLIQSFKTHYPEVENYLQSIIADVEKQGYVTTMFGRRRYLRDITDASYAKREAAKRAALNAPIQGSAADLIKVAMLRVDKLLKEGNYKTKMVLQIHDELLFAMPVDEIDELLPKIKDVMIHAVDLPVKLTVEGAVGTSWYEAKD